jgi:ATP-binding cassette subfamily C protein
MERPRNKANPTSAATIWNYLGELFKEMPGKVTLSLVLTLGLSFTEGVGIVLLVPLLHLAGLDVEQGGLSGLAQWVSAAFRSISLQPTLITVLILYVAITGFHALLRRWQTTLSLDLDHGFVVILRQRLYRAIAYANWLFFSRSRSSDFTHVLTEEVQRVGSATYQLLQLLVTLMVSIIYVAIAIKISAPMTILVFLCGSVMILLLRGRVAIARKAGEETTDAMRRLYSAIGEHIGGMKTAKSHGAEARHVSIFTSLTEQVHGSYIRAVRNQAEVKYWFDMGSVIILSIIAYVSLEVLSVPTAALLLLLFLFARLMPRLSSIQQGFQSLVNLLPAFESVTAMQAQCESASEHSEGKPKAIQLNEGIRLEKVSFRYNETPVIQDIDLSIQFGSTVALVGPSGAGKTTVADLILGLLTSQKGRVLIDGQELLPEMTHHWRTQIGYVPQETFLFYDTIRANLLWANPDADEGKMWRALKMAAAEGFVSRLPDDLDWVVGERGVMLSGGERQRLALARALLRDPSLLILDEATSELDSENEQHILQAIEKLHGAMTIMIISHRLSAVRKADVIYLLEAGRVVESGTWDSLAAEGERFRSLCLAQGITL